MYKKQQGTSLSGLLQLKLGRPLQVRSLVSISDEPPGYADFKFGAASAAYQVLYTCAHSPSRNTGTWLSILGISTTACHIDSPEIRCKLL